MKKYELLEEAHENLVNGSRSDMVKNIDDYGPDEFFPDYKHHLQGLYPSSHSILEYFADATIAYFRIKAR